MASTNRMMPHERGAGTRHGAHARVDESDAWLLGIRRQTKDQTVADAELPRAAGSADGQAPQSVGGRTAQPCRRRQPATRLADTSMTSTALLKDRRRSASATVEFVGPRRAAGNERQEQTIAADDDRTNRHQRQ